MGTPGLAAALLSPGTAVYVSGSAGRATAYDATNPGNLPVISTLFAVLLACLPQAPGAAAAGAEAPAPVRAEAGFEVGVGSGDVSPAVLAQVRELVDRQLPEVAGAFPGLRLRPFFVRVHGTRDGMPDSLRRHLHRDAAGFVLLGQRQVHLVWGEMRRLGSPPGGVVAHELAHELLDQYVAPFGSGMPRWFHEGLAQHLAGDTYLGAREEDLLWRFAARRMLSFADLRERFPDDPDDLQAAYAQSYSYVEWLVGEYGLPALMKVAKNVDRLVTFEGALVGRTGRTTLQLEDAWRYHLRNESGASWRLLLDQCFNLLLVASLPLLAVAVVRRFARERKAAERLARSEAEQPVLPLAGDFAVEPQQVDGDALQGPPYGPPPPPPAGGADDRAP